MSLLVIIILLARSLSFTLSYDMSKTLFDYHNHTYLCGHATGTAEEYVVAAIRLGLTEIGISDHIPMYWLSEDKRDPTIAMSEDKVESYVDTVLSLKTVYPEITIRLGIEADYIPGSEEKLERLLEQYPWDYVYGSVHFIGDWGFDNPEYAHRYEEWDLLELYEKYFEIIASAARSRLFDIIGHIDVIKKWGHEPQESPIELYKHVADVIAESGLAVELNTAGYRKPVGKLYPSGDLLRELVSREVDFVLGSDSHQPSEVGYRLEDAISEAKAYGAIRLVGFSQRRKFSMGQVE